MTAKIKQQPSLIKTAFEQKTHRMTREQHIETAVSNQRNKVFVFRLKFVSVLFVTSEFHGKNMTEPL